MTPATLPVVANSCGAPKMAASVRSLHSPRSTSSEIDRYTQLPGTLDKQALTSIDSWCGSSRLEPSGSTSADQRKAPEGAMGAASPPSMDTETSGSARIPSASLRTSTKSKSGTPVTR